MPSAGRSPDVVALKVACSNCSLRELCLPVGFDDEDMTKLDKLVAKRLAVSKGATLYRAGEPFHSLYAIRAGFFKTRTVSENGREHVTGFQMAGELLGLDGLGTAQHTCDAVALEDSHVCLIHYEQLERLSHQFVQLQRHFHRIMGREISRDHGIMLLMGSMRAEARVAAFLVNLADRLEARGFSPTSLVLRMTREEIGTYLGLKLETVSRAFSKLHDDGLLEVHFRHITLLDKEALRNIAKPAAP